MRENTHFLLTKILATIGPACGQVDALVRMIEAGVRVVRINFSHGGFDDFERSLAVCREAAQRTGIDIGVLGDLCGPKIRVGQCLDDCFLVDEGDLVEFTRKDVLSRRYEDTGVAVVSTSYPEMIDEAEIGDRVLIDDGYVRLLVVDKPYAHDDRGHRLSCRVTHGGKISNRKGINLPDTNIQAPSLTDYDRACTRWAIEPMKTAGGGCIINNSSVAALRYRQGDPLYSALKAAVTHFTKMSGIELGPHNIRVNSISPGAIATPIFWGGSARANTLSDEDNARKMEKLQKNLMI